MKRESSGLEMVMRLMAEQGATSAPSVTCGSSAERHWNPYYVVNRTLKNAEHRPTAP
jgi:hypothetical protein